MPNHVMNRLSFTGKKEDVDKILEAIKSENRSIDFNKLIPMPKELEKTTSPTTIVSEDEYANQMILNEQMAKHDPNDFRIRYPLTEKMQKEYLEKFGADNWYDWKCSNWGTKWGAYYTEQPEIKEGNEYVASIKYQTAWAPSIIIVEKISQMFPNVSVLLNWADEDMSYNTGIVEFMNGECILENQPDGGSTEAYELYFDLWGGREDFEFIDGKYVYKDE